MNAKAKKDIREKTRMAYGLTHVLKEEIDNLRSDVNDFDTYMVKKSVQSVSDTLDKLVTTVAEIEYILHLDSIREIYTSYYEKE